MKLKNFIKNFNFPNPDWESLPVEFPGNDLSRLDTQEKNLYKAIYTMWIVTHPYDHYKKQFAYGILTSTSLSVILLVLSMFLYYADVNYDLGLGFLTEFFA